MIEELQDYLVRHGYSDSLASAIHDAHYELELDGIRAYAKRSHPGCENAFVEDATAWEIEVGEREVSDV